MLTLIDELQMLWEESRATLLPLTPSGSPARRAPVSMDFPHDPCRRPVPSVLGSADTGKIGPLDERELADLEWFLSSPSGSNDEGSS